MMLQWALGYAAIGWPVFRLRRSKKPFPGSHGFKDATTDPAVIRSWWAEGADFPNIGLACGVPTALQPGGIVVIDCDGPGGLADYEALAPGNGWPRTWCSQTARGRHYFFRAPAGVDLRCHNAPRAVKGGDGLDLKGTGGYVVLPPSINAQGVRYVWLVGPHEAPGGPAGMEGTP